MPDSVWTAIVFIGCLIFLQKAVQPFFEMLAAVASRFSFRRRFVLFVLSFFSVFGLF